MSSCSIAILRGVEGLNLVGADIVEVAPAYDGNGEATALAGAQVAYELITNMVKRGLKDRGEEVVLPKPGKQVGALAKAKAKAKAAADALRDEL